MTLSRDVYILDCEVLNSVVLCNTKKTCISITITIQCWVSNCKVLNNLTITIEVTHKAVLLSSRANRSPIISSKVDISCKNNILTLECITTAIYLVSQPLKTSSTVNLILIAYNINALLYCPYIVCINSSIAISYICRWVIFK